MIFEQKDLGNVFSYNTKKETKVVYPEVGKTYYAYDDGKISIGRELKFKITKVIDLDTDRTSKTILKMLASEIKRCYWLYSPEQHVIYRGKAIKKDGSYDKDVGYQWFILTKDNEWFGVGKIFWDSLLDVQGYYYKMAHETF